MDSDDSFGLLNERERQVFDCLVRGMTIKETASALTLSPKTVGRHKASIMRKLGVNNMVELVSLAIGPPGEGCAGVLSPLLPKRPRWPPMAGKVPLPD